MQQPLTQPAAALFRNPPSMRNGRLGRPRMSGGASSRPAGRPRSGRARSSIRATRPRLPAARAAATWL